MTREADRSAVSAQLDRAGINLSQLQRAQVLTIRAHLLELHRRGAAIQLWHSGQNWNVRIWPHGRPTDRLDYSRAIHYAKRNRLDALAHAIMGVQALEDE